MAPTTLAELDLQAEKDAALRVEQALQQAVRPTRPGTCRECGRLVEIRSGAVLPHGSWQALDCAGRYQPPRGAL